MSAERDMPLSYDMGATAAIRLDTQAGMQEAPVPEITGGDGSPSRLSYDARRSFYSDTYEADCAPDATEAQLDYTRRATGILHATTRPKDRTPASPLFTAAERVEMERIRRMGISPEGYAHMLITRDKAKGRA